MLPPKIIQPERQACLALIDSEESLLFAEGYDDAILGVVEIHGVLVVAYDARRVVRTLRTRDAMSLDDAEEFFACNIAGSHMGECSPVFVQRIPTRKAK